MQWELPIWYIQTLLVQVINGTKWVISDFMRFITRNTHRWIHPVDVNGDQLSNGPLKATETYTCHYLQLFGNHTADFRQSNYEIIWTMALFGNIGGNDNLRLLWLVKKSWDNNKDRSYLVTNHLVLVDLPILDLNGNKTILFCGFFFVV